MNTVGATVAPSPEPVSRWMDRHVREIATADEPAISLYVQRADRWRHTPTWPLPETVWTSLFLGSNGKLSESPGTGFDAFRYDPRDPARSAGGTFLTGIRGAGVFDQSEVERRDDVLVYTATPVADGLEITGPVEVELFATTSAVDTDFTAKLCDVSPAGVSLNVCEGVTRLRFRPDFPGLVEPGSVQRVRIELSPTSYWFAPGHAVRLQISSSSFPLVAPNPNTGRNWLVEDHEPVVTDQTVLHSSRLILPFMP
jgi:putative CocE/NonD family hydrolase